MTEHPLTDDVLKQIGCENPLELPCLSISGRVRVFGTQAMRTAYDLGRDEQLEQVIEWFNETIFERSLHEAVDIPEELAQAMRPPHRRTTDG